MTAAQVRTINRLCPARLWRNKHGQLIAVIGDGIYAILAEGNLMRRSPISEDEEAEMLGAEAKSC